MGDIEEGGVGDEDEDVGEGTSGRNEGRLGTVGNLRGIILLPFILSKSRLALLGSISVSARTET